MKFKKVISLMLSTVLAFTLLSCGKTAQGTTDTSGSVKDATESTGRAQEDSKGGEIDYYGFDHEIPIKVGFAWGQDFSFAGGDDAMNNPWMDLYREHNIIPEILYEVDSSQAETKLSTAIMSGNYPDVFMINVNEYSKMVQSGVIADITDYLDQYATPELMEYLTVDNGLVLESLSVDGRIYGLPKMGNSYDSMKVMFIREDWLKNLNLQIPTTMEELKEVARAFTFDDPDGNGVNDTYGLALDGVDVITGSIGTATAVFEGFGAYPTSLAFIENEGEVVWGGSLSDEMKAGLTILQEMYTEGSIARDFITMDSNSIFEEAGAGRCGIFFAPMWGAMSASYNTAKLDPNAMFISAPVPDGSGTGESKALFKSGYDTIYVVSSKCENPEVLIKLMNLSVQKLCHPESEEEFIKYTSYQGEGDYAVWKVSLTPTLEPLKNYDNYLKISKALISGDEQELNMEQKGNYTAIKAYLDMLEVGDFDADDPTFQAGSGLYTVFGNPQGSYAALETLIKADRFVYTAYNTLPNEKMSEVGPTLNKMLVETIVKIITGDPVENYDNFLSSWKAMGGDEITADAQAWVDSVK